MSVWQLITSESLESNLPSLSTLHLPSKHDITTFKIANNCPTAFCTNRYAHRLHLQMQLDGSWDLLGTGAAWWSAQEILSGSSRRRHAVGHLWLRPAQYSNGRSDAQSQFAIPAIGRSCYAMQVWQRRSLYCTVCTVWGFIILCVLHSCTPHHFKL